MELTKQELLAMIKSEMASVAGVALTDEDISKIGDKIKGTMVDEINEKITKLTEVQENKIAKIEQENKKEPKWKGFNDQLTAIRKAGTPNMGIDKRLVEVKDITGMNEGVGADGGFMIDPEYSKEILFNAHEAGIVAKDCKRLSVAGNSLILKAIDETSRVTGSRWGGIRGYWVGEGTTATASAPKFRRMQLTLNKLEVILYATDELLDDAPALTGLTTQGVGEEFAVLLDDALISGTGVGMPFGILNSAALVSQAAETGQTADTVVAENIIKMWNRVPSANRMKAKWYINQDVEVQLPSLHIKLGTAAVPLFVPPGNGIVNSPNGSLYNRPLQPIEQCKAIGDVGDIILADMSQYLILEKTVGILTSSSVHVRFLYDEKVFKFVLRVEGQPMWNSAVTPMNGSTTRSPFVALAAR